MKLDGLMIWTRMYFISNITGRENLLINHHQKVHPGEVAEQRNHLGVPSQVIAPCPQQN